MTGKTRAEILSDALREGARLRLLELNRERDILLGVLGDAERAATKAREIVAHVTREKPRRRRTHWMRRPENKARMMRQVRKMQRARMTKLQAVA